MGRGRSPTRHRKSHRNGSQLEDAKISMELLEASLKDGLPRALARGGRIAIKRFCSEVRQ